MDWLICCACAARLAASCRLRRRADLRLRVPRRDEFRRHVADIAWETEVWIASDPDHLVHFNGEKFLGPLLVEG